MLQSGGFPSCFCEVNKYAELSPYETHCPITNISSRAASYGFPGHTVNGEDVFEVYSATLEAVSRARRGDGPSLVEAKAFVGMVTMKVTHKNTKHLKIGIILSNLIQ